MPKHEPFHQNVRAIIYNPKYVYVYRKPKYPKSMEHKLGCFFYYCETPSDLNNLNKPLGSSGYVQKKTFTR